MARKKSIDFSSSNCMLILCSWPGDPNYWLRLILMHCMFSVNSKGNQLEISSKFCLSFRMRKIGCVHFKIILNLCALLSYFHSEVFPGSSTSCIQLMKHNELNFEQSPECYLIVAKLLWHHIKRPLHLKWEMWLKIEWV